MTSDKSTKRDFIASGAIVGGVAVLGGLALCLLSDQTIRQGDPARLKIGDNKSSKQNVSKRKDRYFVSDNCIRCKYQECTEVCPVDAFRDGETMLVIDASTCISCGLCISECPIGSIKIIDEKNIEKVSIHDAKMIYINDEYSSKWPVIAQKGVVPSDADEYRHQINKFERYFSP